MVRFIIKKSVSELKIFRKFTFQYGQIYYFANLQIITQQKIDLHSNMVRFIMRSLQDFRIDIDKFTFQYGQIYYEIKHELFN